MSILINFCIFYSPVCCWLISVDLKIPTFGGRGKNFLHPYNKPRRLKEKEKYRKIE
jgi:hypothetical protein